MSKKSKIAAILGMTVEESEILNVIRLTNEVTGRLYNKLLTSAEKEVAQAMCISYAEACKAKYKPGTPEAKMLVDAERAVQAVEKAGRHAGK